MAITTAAQIFGPPYNPDVISAANNSISGNNGLVINTVITSDGTNGFTWPNGNDIITTVAAPLSTGITFTFDKFTGYKDSRMIFKIDQYGNWYLGEGVTLEEALEFMAREMFKMAPPSDSKHTRVIEKLLEEMPCVCEAGIECTRCEAEKLLDE